MFVEEEKGKINDTCTYVCRRNKRTTDFLLRRMFVTFDTIHLLILALNEEALKKAVVCLGRKKIRVKYMSCTYVCTRKM